MARHLAALDEAILKTLTGFRGCRRLLVSMPPRHGKSELCSKYLPVHFLGTHPDREVILCGYGNEFASEWGRKARDVMNRSGAEVFNGLSIRTDSHAADHWLLAGHEGGMRTAGVGGGITGKGADLFIIDDALKGAAAAYSKIERDKVWNWYVSECYTRLAPGGAIIVVATRWHEDDLTGRLIRAMKEGGEQWRVLKLPAIDDFGNALWPERYPIATLDKFKALDAAWWEALYQQNPTPREGLFFKPDMMGLPLPSAPIEMRECRAWDLAASDGKGNWTVGVRMGITPQWKPIIVDVVRGQWESGERDRIIRQTARLDGPHVLQHAPQDPGAAGKSYGVTFIRMLAGLPVKVSPVSGSKTLRADPFASQVNVGNVGYVAGPWNKAYLEELRTFPLGANDDQIDASADAFRELTLGAASEESWDEVEYART